MEYLIRRLITMHIFWTQIINYCCFNSYDGKLLASGSSDKQIKIWNIEEKKELFVLG